MQNIKTSGPQPTLIPVRSPHLSSAGPPRRANAVAVQSDITLTDFRAGRGHDLCRHRGPVRSRLQAPPRIKSLIVRAVSGGAFRPTQSWPSWRSLEHDDGLWQATTLDWSHEDATANVFRLGRSFVRTAKRSMENGYPSLSSLGPHEVSGIAYSVTTMKRHLTR
jgi:hypothetical protein